MEEFDKIFKSKLENRTIDPSTSAWERLSEQLDQKEKRKSGKIFLYVGYAASIILLLSIYLMINKEDVNTTIVPNEIIVGVGDPEDGWSLISVQQAEGTMSEQSDIFGVRIASLDSVLDEVHVPHDIVGNVARNVEVVTRVRSNSAVE